MATAQESFASARSTYLVPALRELGFRVKSRAIWLRGSSERGWLVVEAGGNRRNTKTQGDWSVSVYCWPPGTWEWECVRSGGGKPEPDSSLAPLYARVDLVSGEPEALRPTVTFTSDMSETEVARTAEALLRFARIAIAWVEHVLATGTADQYTSPAYVLGAAEVTARWTPTRLELLDTLTARAQRGERKPPWEWLARWRDAAGLESVPFPQWHHPLMRMHAPLDRFASPRDAFTARHGSAVELLFPDGSRRLPTPHDFPDARQLRAWRKVATEVPDVPLSDPPPWLPWHEWVFRQPEGRGLWLDWLRGSQR